MTTGNMILTDIAIRYSEVYSKTNKDTKHKNTKNNSNNQQPVSLQQVICSPGTDGWQQSARQS